MVTSYPTVMCVFDVSGREVLMLQVLTLSNKINKHFTTQCQIPRSKVRKGRLGRNECEIPTSFCGKGIQNLS